jgi:hypothetical protein
MRQGRIAPPLLLRSKYQGMRVTKFTAREFLGNLLRLSCAPFSFMPLGGDPVRQAMTSMSSVSRKAPKISSAWKAHNAPLLFGHASSS